MRVLLDECVDRRLASDILGHDVKTVPDAGWAALKNGDLLTRAERDFDAFVTVDRNLPFQQDLARFSIPWSCCVRHRTASRICADSSRGCSQLCLGQNPGKLHGLAADVGGSRCAWRATAQEKAMRKARYPAGWDQKRIRRVLEHYEGQSDEEAIAEDEAADETTTHTTMVVPVELVPAVRELIAKRRAD